MPKLAVIGLFCEDIREEKSGQDTLIGILPDNLHLTAPGQSPDSTAPKILPRLCVYVRFAIDPSYQPKRINIRLKSAGGEDIDFGPMDPALIRKAIDDARASKSPIAGVIFKIIMGNFPAKTDGRIQLVANVDDEELICGALNVRFLKQPTSATASAPPA